VLRSGAKAGDVVCVTGCLGGAWRSGRHMTFTPRIRQARTLAGKYTLHAMIDISDGLASDLRHICKASLVAAEIEAAAIPIHPDAMTTPQDQFKSVSLPAPLAAALGEGEDYELLFTLPQDQADQLLRDRPLDVPVTRIGTIVAGNNITLISADGRRQEMPAIGWEHGK
jgi:thiamine-monophosphate kinase